MPERLGKYLIRGELGRGAMGIVYEGFDPLIERTVAIKVLHIEPGNPALAAEVRHRFKREAQAAGRLSHPNIVQVYDYGEAAELSSAFIAMELIRGRDLKRLLDDGVRFTLQETRRIMGELLGALQHAHERGVIHRDIKPGNIILLDDGTVKVADFGIAKVDSSDLTQVGSVLGTVSHMSPEQLSGQPVDRRSDVFSCGVILYELLTGERPFSGSPATVIQKVLHEEPLPPSRLVAGLPPGIDAVVRRAMAKAPAQRFASAADFRDAVRKALAVGADPDATVVPDVPEAGRPAKRLAVVGGIAAAAIAATGAVAWRWLSPSGPAPSRPAIEAAAPVAVPQTVSVAVPAPAPAPLPQPEPARPVIAVPSEDEIERLAWEDASKANAVAAYEAYLKSYPKGRFASRARVRIAALQPKPMPAAGTAAAPASPPAVAMAPAPAAPPTVTTAPLPSPAPVPGRAASLPATAPAPASAAPAADKSTVVAASPRPPEPRTATPQVRPEPPPPPASRVANAAPPSKPAQADKPAVAKGEPECAEEASRGDARCQVALGLRYRQGKGVPKDPAEAVRWFQRAADQGFAAGQHELGVMHATGSGVPTDWRQALHWFRSAAELGEPRSQNRMGQAYEDGNGVPRNVVVAADWYRKAADQGNASAQTNLGRLYLRGQGVFKDTAKAAELLQKAADQGEPNARFHLGWMYEKGDGKPRDSQQAARLYRQALSSSSLGDRNREAAKAFLAANPAL